MADFELVLTKAIAGLATNSAEHRRALYDRARTSLLAQLKSLNPPLPQTEIAKQRLALEHAIRKVESHVALGEISRFEAPIAKAPPVSMPVPSPTHAQPEIAPQSPSVIEAKLEVKPELKRPQVSPLVFNAKPELPAFLNAPQAAPVPEVIPEVAAPTPDEAPVFEPSKSAENAEEDLAVLAQRMAPKPEFMDPELPAFLMPQDDDVFLEQSRPAPRFGERRKMATPVAPEPVVKKSKSPQLFSQPPVRFIDTTLDADLDAIPAEYTPDIYPKKPSFFQSIAQKLASLRSILVKPSFDGGSEDVLLEAQQAPQEVKQPRFGRSQLNMNQRRNAIVAGLFLVTIIGAGFVLISSDMVTRVLTSVPRVVIGASENLGTSITKNTARLEAEKEGVEQIDLNAEALTNVAQAVILYEENPNIPQKGEAFRGQVIWRVESESAADGKPEKFIRGELEVPARKMKVQLSIRRNFDITIPASHTIELSFELPPDFVQKGISSVPGVLMKPAEQARGVPLIGASARITNSYFLIALSNLAADKERNILNLKERNWLEIPILYDTRLRAVLVMDKGIAGERLFKSVFAGWKQ